MGYSYINVLGFFGGTDVVWTTEGGRAIGRGEKETQILVNWSCVGFYVADFLHILFNHCNFVVFSVLVLGLVSGICLRVIELH